jgi:hypothetical protein
MLVDVLLRWVMLFGAVFGAAACGDDPEAWESGRPLISKLTYLQQLAEDPYKLQFAIEFQDSNGDLGGGKVHLFTNGEEKPPLALLDVFEKQMIEPGAIAGELELSVTLPKDIQDNEKVKIGFVLEDAAGNKSNDPSVVLQALAPGG